ncbi:hypothetical protein B7P43_G16729 [Cryptotermes secundus]|uniref:Uncharacterized protein n=1 Tax=Cryptotermes secundus TaxID=105785 RepID=A0A2J7QWK2_9NEOP|nr:hypothetical protein B7P43_G16729 [Cryptotermes secundus]
MMEPTVCETRWKGIVASFEKTHDDLKAMNPDCRKEIELLRNGLHITGQLILTSPSVNENGVVWKELIIKSEVERIVLCKHLDGKALFTAILGMYTDINREM